MSTIHPFDIARRAAAPRRRLRALAVFVVTALFGIGAFASTASAQYYYPHPDVAVEFHGEVSERFDAAEGRVDPAIVPLAPMSGTATLGDYDELFVFPNGMGGQLAFYQVEGEASFEVAGFEFTAAGPLTVIIANDWLLEGEIVDYWLISRFDGSDAISGPHSCGIVLNDPTASLLEDTSYFVPRSEDGWHFELGSGITTPSSSRRPRSSEAPSSSSPRSSP
jgi:hypothetical protein